MFGCHGKHYFPENDFRLTTNFTFEPEMNFSPHFHFNSLPEKERERERARARGEDPVRDRELQLQSDGAITIPSFAIDGAIARGEDPVDRDLAPSRSHDRDRAPSIAIWRHRDRAVIAILCCDR